MSRHKTNKEVKSINFDIEVLRELENHCRKSGIDVSSFVNGHMRKIVMNEYEFYRTLAKHYASELAKYQLLMNSSPDKEDKK